MEQIQDQDMEEGGYFRQGMGGDLTFISKSGVEGSSLLTCSPLNLFIPIPVSHFNCTNLSAHSLILSIFLFLTMFFLLLLWSVSSSGSRSSRSNWQVSHCTRWTYVSLSKVLGRVKKKYRVLRICIPSSTCWARWSLARWHFCEHVFIAGGEATISTIGNIAKCRGIDCQMECIWCI